jgi:NAD(P)-dependent dehydrogenase (short-subunit alcohol dehydrogenase family)
MLFLILLINLSFCLPAPFPIPAGTLPSGNPIVSDLTGKLILIIGGLKGIANQSAHQFAALGATVVITTRNKNGVISPFDVFELEFGKKNSLDKFFDKWQDKYGVSPDIIDMIGTQYVSGDLLDLSDYDFEWASKLYFVDPLVFINRMLKMSVEPEVPRPMNITIALSTAGFGSGSTFLSYYALGKTLLKDFIYNFNVYYGPHNYPHVRIAGVSCAYAKTSFVANQYNPSIIKGDQFNIALNQVVLNLENLIGTNPAVIAAAHVEASVALNPSNNSIYLVPPLTGRSASDTLYSIYASDTTTQFVADTRLAYLSFGLNISAYI